MTTTLDVTLGNDADFQVLYRSVTTIGSSVLRVGSTLTTEAQRTLVASLQSENSTRARAALHTIGATKQVIDEQRRLLRALVDRYHLPLDATLPDAFADAAVAAKWSYTEEEGGGPAPDPWDELEEELEVPESGGGSSDDGNDACYDGCVLQAAALAASAIAAYMAALAGCTAAGPFALLCWAGASAAYVIALYEMDAVVDRCVANCGG